VKLIVVDRDVVLEHPLGAVSTPEAWQPVPGSAEALARMAHAGYHVVVMADQAALTRGICDMSALNAAHARMIAGVEAAGGRIDAVFFQPPEPSDTGTKVTAAFTLRSVLDRLRVSCDNSIVVSDSSAVLAAALEAGCRAVLLLTGSGRRALESGNLPTGTLVRVDLSALASDLAC
jgi:D-glycero-D-manno-heptose 1,7-bisphosphate phosphatase